MSVFLKTSQVVISSKARIQVLGVSQRNPDSSSRSLLGMTVGG